MTAAVRCSLTAQGLRKAPLSLYSGTLDFWRGEITPRWQTVPCWLEAASTVRATHFRPALSLLGFLLTPVAVLAGGVGAWRFGADAGWTRTFFISEGFLSHWQIWCAFAISAQACAHGINRGMPDRVLRIPKLIRVKSLSSRRRKGKSHGAGF